MLRPRLNNIFVVNALMKPQPYPVSCIRLAGKAFAAIIRDLVDNNAVKNIASKYIASGAMNHHDMVQAIMTSNIEPITKMAGSV